MSYAIRAMTAVAVGQPKPRDAMVEHALLARLRKKS
jgi:hypothetical protein